MAISKTGINEVMVKLESVEIQIMKLKAMPAGIATLAGKARAGEGECLGYRTRYLCLRISKNVDV